MWLQLPKNLNRYFQSNTLWKVLGGALALILIYLIVNYFLEHPEIFSSLQNLEFQHISMVITLDSIVIALFALRTYVALTHGFDGPLRFWSWFRIYVVGQLLNFFLSQSGDLYRAHAAKRQSELPYANYAAVFLVMSWLDMIIVFSLAAGLRLITPTEMSPYHLPTTTLVTFVMGWLAVAPVGTLILRSVISIRLCPHLVQQPIDKLLKEFWRVIQNRRSSGYLILTALLSFIIMTLMVVVIFRGLGVNIIFYQAALILAVYRLSQAVLFTPGNIGVREWSVGGVCLALGFDPGYGLLFSLIMRAVHLLALGLTGSVFLIRQRFSWPV